MGSKGLRAQPALPSNAAIRKTPPTRSMESPTRSPGRLLLCQSEDGRGQFPCVEPRHGSGCIGDENAGDMRSTG
jgi:hypothetical protein